MITAIINARSSSERLPSKHLIKIGNKSIFEHIISKLKKIKKINQIYIATGSKQKNYVYEKFLRKIGLKKIKFFYYNNENNVTERIYRLTKKIKTKYSILISGDCPLIDIDYINRIITQLTNNKKFDFIYPKNEIIHEGIKLFKTNAWNKVHRLSKEKKYLENPGYIVKKKSDKFSILKYNPLDYEKVKKYRISVDTESDLEFLNYIYILLKKKNKDFNLKNLLKIKRLKILNEHVLQRHPDQKKIKTIIITSKNNETGLGHFNRSLVIKREIIEKFNSKVDILVLNPKSNFINLKKKLKIANKNYDLKIIDLNKKYISKIEKIIYNFKKTLIIDNILKNKKVNYLVPNLIKNKKKTINICGGEKYIILNRKIIYNNLITTNSKIKIEKLLLIGGSFSTDPEIDNFIQNSKKNLKIIIGPLVKNDEITNLRNKGYSIIQNPQNIFDIIKGSKQIYCRFGISAFEAIALGKKPIVFSKYNFKDKDVINNLYQKNYIQIFGKKKQFKLKKININKNLENLTNLIKKIIK